MSVSASSNATTAALCVQHMNGIRDTLSTSHAVCKLGSMQASLSFSTCILNRHCYPTPTIMKEYHTIAAQAIHVELSRTHLDVWAVGVCPCGGGIVGLVTVLDAKLAVYPTLCRLADRLAVKLGETLTAERGGTTQYSIGKPSKYGIFGTMASSPCTTHTTD